MRESGTHRSCVPHGVAQIPDKTADMAKANPLQEQLLKAGLVKKSKVAEVAREQHKARHGKGPSQPRSEEHTSELQSLMRISYAVFCLKKKNNTRTKSIRNIELLQLLTTAKDKNSIHTLHITDRHISIQTHTIITHIV